MSSVNESGDISKTTNSQTNGTIDPTEWQKEQTKLINMICEFEKKLSQTTMKINTLENDLKLRTQERDKLKVQVSELQEQLADSQKEGQQYTTDSQIVDAMKQKSEEMLTRAKGVIFEKTKICKNQELQIEALTQQVTSLKEVVAITKDLLDIRNIEVKHLQEKMNCMGETIEAEKERYNLMHTKLDKMVEMNTELKREYETQLVLFSALRGRYNERELARNVLNTTTDETTEGDTTTDGQNN